eukprot:Opistho-2@59018
MHEETDTSYALDAIESGALSEEMDRTVGALWKDAHPGGAGMHGRRGRGRGSKKRSDVVGMDEHIRRCLNHEGTNALRRLVKATLRLRSHPEGFVRPRGGSTAGGVETALHAAQLAGLSPTVIDRARIRLERMFGDDAVDGGHVRKRKRTEDNGTPPPD